MPVRHEIATPWRARDDNHMSLRGALRDEAIPKRSEIVRHEIATASLMTLRDDHRRTLLAATAAD
jgi:hypothetical protein